MSKADISNIWDHKVAPHRCWATISLKLMAKTFVHCIQKLGPQPTFSHLKLGTAVTTEYHKHVPNVPATALHFSETKENLLQLSITAIFIQSKNLEQRQMEIWQICHTERQYHFLFFKNSLHCLAPCQQLRDTLQSPLLGSHEFWGRSTFEN